MAMKRNSRKNNYEQEAVPPLRLKVISMGSGAAGKSCLIKRYCEDRFVSKYIATIGVDYGVKPIQVSKYIIVALFSFASPSNEMPLYVQDCKSRCSSEFLGFKRSSRFL